MLNSDNYYPVAALKTLAELSSQGLIGFTPEGLARGNLEQTVFRNFAVFCKQVQPVNSNESSRSRRRKELVKLGPRPLVSMNCWRFGPGALTRVIGSSFHLVASGSWSPQCSMESKRWGKSGKFYPLMNRCWIWRAAKTLHRLLMHSSRSP